MSISYLSQPTRSSAYVPPVDLGIMAKVLSTHQQQFDLGAQKEQDAINQMASLDVVRPQDRQYLNDKINNLVSTVNNFGGQDYGDPNILNQIEGLGSDIYGDGKVINAIASSKRVRNLTAGYDKLKTDPKLSKMYAPQNEYEDMSHVNEWMQNGEVGASYDGPSAPTPYSPWRDNLTKVVAQTKADKYESTMVDGFYINKTTGQRVTPDRVFAEAEENLLPQERDQMKRDGNYLYKDVSPENIIQKGIFQVNQRFNDAKTLKDYYEKQADASVTDPEQRMRFNSLADQQASQMASLSRDPLYTADAAIKSYKANPKEFKYQVYKNDAFKGLADIYSYNQTTTDQKPNTVAMYMDRKAQAEKQFDEKLAQDDTHFYTELAFKAREKGLQMVIDPNSKAINYVPLGSSDGTGGLSSTTINTQDPEDARVTSNSLRSMNDSLELEKQSVYNSAWDDLIQHHEELGHVVPSLLSPTGHQGELYGQQYLEMLNGKEGLQPEDLKALQDNQLVQGQYKNAVKAAGGDPVEAMKTMTQLWSNYNTILNGNGKTVGELPPEFVNAANKVQLINERQRAIQAIQNQAKNIVASQAGWSKEQTDYYFKHNNDNLQNISMPSEQHAYSSYYSSTPPADPKIQALNADLREKGIDAGKIQTSFYNTLSTRDVFQTHIFANTEGDIKSREAANFVAAEVAAGHGDVYVDGKKISNTPFSITDVNKIRPIQSGLMSDGSGRYFIQSQIDVGTADKPKLAQIVVPLSDENAAKMNLSRDPAENINYSVNLTGSTGDLNIYGDNNLAVTAQIKKKNLRSLNDYSSFAVIKIFSKDQNGNKIPGKFVTVPVPGTDAVTPADAYRSINDVVQRAAAINRERIKSGQPAGTIDDFNKWMIDNRKP